MALLSLDHVDVSLDGTPILHDVTATVEAGTWVGVIGPNGSGKTTLLRAIGGHVDFGGEIRLDGTPLHAWSARERARRVAFVRQAPSLTFDFTVEELVLLGRAPHASWLSSYGAGDRERVRAALRRVGMDGFASRSVLTLSGGEVQRVFLAQALVQEASLLLLDEPTSHLDVHYQYGVLSDVAGLVDEGRTALVVVHDLQLAARFAERLLVMHEGRLVADGTPRDVLTPERIAEVFRMHASVASGDPFRIEYEKPVDGQGQES